MPAQKHTAENLAKLVSSIGRQCEANAVVLCFACIKTLPEQSEIKVTIANGMQPTQKIIDIIADKDGNMIFANMHN